MLESECPRKSDIGESLQRNKTQSARTVQELKEDEDYESINSKQDEVEGIVLPVEEKRRKETTEIFQKLFPLLKATQRQKSYWSDSY